MKFFFSLAIFFCTLQLNYAQVQDKQKPKFGINLSLNQSNVQSIGKLDDHNYEILNDLGFGLGLFNIIDFNEQFFAKTEAALVFNGGGVKEKWPRERKDTLLFNPLDIEIGTRIGYKITTGKYKPILYLGTHVKIPLGNSTKTWSMKTDIGLDIGFGFEKWVKNFFYFSPEIIYSLGLKNINDFNFIKDKYYYHRLAFIINIYG